MKDVFLSFSSKDVEQAESLCRYIESNDISCFIAYRDIVPGHEYAAQLIDNLGAAKVVVLLLSQNSNQSPHVLREIEHAVSHNIPVIVYKLDEVEINRSLEYFLMTHQWLADSEDRNELLIKSIRLIILDHEAKHADDKKEEAGNKKSDTSYDMTKKVKPVKSSESGKGWIVGVTAIVAVTIIAVTAMILLLSKDKTKNPEEYAERKPEEQIIEDDEKGSTDENDVTDEDEVISDGEEAYTAADKYNVGDTIEFGTYNGETIEWRVIQENQDGSVVLISKYVICLKPFDSAESGAYNTYNDVEYSSLEVNEMTDEEMLIQLRGNNDWSVSNIRTWLNSSDELVIYYDQAPTAKAVLEHVNYYNYDAGFLYEFTDEEINNLVQVRNKTIANSLSKNAEDGYVYSYDYVYLLSYEELSMLYDAGIPIFTSPTQNCIDTDESGIYLSCYVDLGVDNIPWWLRDPSEELIYQAMMVCTEYEEYQADVTVYPTTVAVGNYGVRPVITIKN